ncbi:MAG: hypothetical protein RL637_111 [Pseudomonadota bacterium]|jgi:MtN3 and saliva related transmembrane protein
MHISIESISYLAAFCTTLSFLPQAILTLRTQDTRSLSLGMYSLFTLGLILWLIYGIAKHDLALIWGNLITLLFAATILICKIKSLLHKKDQ